MTQTDHNRLPLSHRPLPLLVKEIMSSVVSLCENLFGKYLALRSVPKPNKPGQTKYVATNIFWNIMSAGVSYRYVSSNKYHAYLLENSNEITTEIFLGFGKNDIKERQSSLKVSSTEARYSTWFWTRNGFQLYRYWCHSSTSASGSYLSCMQWYCSTSTVDSAGSNGLSTGTKNEDINRGLSGCSCKCHHNIHITWYNSVVKL